MVGRLAVVLRASAGRRHGHAGRALGRPSRLTGGQAVSCEMCKARPPHSTEGCPEAGASGLDRAHWPTHKFIFMCKTVAVEDQRDKWQFLGQTSKCCFPLWFPFSGLQEILLQSHARFMFECPLSFTRTQE